MKKTIIVACSLNNVIGRNGELPWKDDARYKGDLRRFKELTLGHTVIMGRKTFESIGKKALPDRRNIVISRKNKYENVETFSSIEAALSACNNDDDVFFIGGCALYDLALSYADEVDFTIIPEMYYHESTDKIEELTYFCVLGDEDDWELSEEFTHPYNGLLKVKKFVKSA